MKAQFFTSTALVLLSAFPAALSDKPKLRAVILATTDFEDQLNLYDSEDEDLFEDVDMEPYEEEFDSSEDYEMEPDEENFYGMREGGRGGMGGPYGQGNPYYNGGGRSGRGGEGGGGRSGGRDGDCESFQAWNCGSGGRGGRSCTWTDDGCVSRSGRGGGRGGRGGRGRGGRGGMQRTSQGEGKLCASKIPQDSACYGLCERACSRHRQWGCEWNRARGGFCDGGY